MAIAAGVGGLLMLTKASSKSAPAGPRWIKVWATSFLEDGGTRANGTKRPATIACKGYWGNYTMKRRDILVALPSVTAYNRLVDVRYRDKVVESVPVYDGGPWNVGWQPYMRNGVKVPRSEQIWTDDPYWETGSRPQTESGFDKQGRKTNKAGIDLSWALWEALGIPANKVENWSDYVEWKFHE